MKQEVFKENPPQHPLTASKPTFLLDTIYFILKSCFGSYFIATALKGLLFFFSLNLRSCLAMVSSKIIGSSFHRNKSKYWSYSLT